MKRSVFHVKRPLEGPLSWTPAVDSNSSCLSDSEEDNEDSAPPAGHENLGNIEGNDDWSSSDEDDNRTQDALPASTKITSVAWKTVKQQNSEKAIPPWQSALPEADKVRQPIQYFRDFFDSDLCNIIVVQTNLYYMQQNPCLALNLDQKELEQFLGTVVYMSVFNLPRSRMYWSSSFRMQQVADVMSRERWEEVNRFLHFSDSLAPNNDDKLFKVRSVIDSLLNKFQALPQEQMLCVDEQTVQGKSSVKRCTSMKPHKSGYKIFVLRDTKGLVHSFEVFTGKMDPAPGRPDIGASGNIALKLAQVIHPNVNHLLYFDNRFSSVNLFVALAKMGIPALGTVQPNSLGGCSFRADSEMKREGRGTFEEQQAAVDGVEMRAVKWFDKRGVIVASTFASAQPVSHVDRWDRKLKQKVSVQCPNIFRLCDRFRGGVDALHALNAHYRISIRSRKFYHRLFYRFLDMVIVNSWLLYRRDCESLGVPKKQQDDMLAFRTSIAHALCLQGKDLSKKERGWPSLSVQREIEMKKRRGPTKRLPTQEIRSDAVAHWPVVERVRNRCKLPLCTGHTVMKCAKCNVHLCLNKYNNCFRKFHE